MRQNKGRRLGEGGGLGLTGDARFGRKRLQMGGAPVTNSVILGVCQAERRKRGRRGHPGGFIGSRCLAEGVRVRAQGEIDGGGGVGLGRVLSRGRRRHQHVGPRHQRLEAYCFG
jgi:hypothetical protein